MARDKKITHKIMSAIKSKNTSPERLLGKELWHNGLRYRKHYNILGKPDFVFVKLKIAIFCDGDFWHGNNWKIRGLGSLEEELSRYSMFWKDKILKNIQRDKKVNKILEDEGWTVIRIWESDLKTSLQDCVERIKRVYYQKKLQQSKRSSIIRRNS
ncbi:MAG: very short patch repair endonuclease [Clostridiales bacterium]|nr:very short patch repair endonuclease [Eubacteriales bacterium]MDH7566790.1 very short patch repair endonuclease [Clostridiales bacterium]